MTVTKQLMGSSTMEVNGVYQLSGYRHSTTYLLLCSAEERNSCFMVSITEFSFLNGKCHFHFP